MALSPSIPTSFVPKQPVETGNRRYSKGTNLFLAVAVAIFILAVVSAAGVFLYSTYLQSVEKSKAAQVSDAEKKASAADVEDFIRLRNRLAASKQIINQHVVLSQFFTLLENITVEDVQYNNLILAISDDRSAKITLKGTARSINSLAAESTAFASQKQIKNAVFSGIAVNPDGSVAFSVDGNIDPSLIQEAAAPTTSVLSSTGTTTPPVQTINTAPIQQSAAASTTKSTK